MSQSSWSARPLSRTSPAQDAAAWPGAVVRGRSGATLGHLDHLYVDRTTGRPTFAALAVEGLPGVLPVVPIELLSGHHPADGLTADVSAGALAAAPEVVGAGGLDPSQEAVVRRHFGVSPERG
jgi:hypothetical protein